MDNGFANEISIMFSIAIEITQLVTLTICTEGEAGPEFNTPYFNSSSCDYTLIYNADFV